MVKDTIQGRIMRSLIILMLAVLFLSGLSLYTVFDMTNTFQTSSQALEDNRNMLFDIRLKLEQAAVVYEAGTSGKNDSKQFADAKKVKVAFNAAADHLIETQKGRPWSPKTEFLKVSFETLESSAVPTQRDAFQKHLAEIRSEVNSIQDQMTAAAEIETFANVRYLAMLIAAVAFATIVIPAGTFWLTTQKINGDLTTFVQSLYDFSEQNDETSEVLRLASQSLSAASTEQAAAVHESVSSITEMRSMLGETGNHVREVQTLTATMNQNAQDGSTIMARMESAMIAIEQANRQLESFEEILQSIRGKTTVINDIVFKTQLLSFNASIEAARAGQYGRGFAVVAEEVGKLAQMSGDASKEIDQLLGHSQDRVVKIVEAVQARVSDGKEVTSDASKRFSEIARQIATITEKVNQVGDASSEQARGVDETARAMDQMNNAATDNRTSSEEIFKVAEKLRDLSTKIRGVTEGIRRFVREHKQTEPTRFDEIAEVATFADVLAPTPEPVPVELDDNFEFAKPAVVHKRGDAILNIVDRLAQKRALGKLVPTPPIDQISADDPSFRASGQPEVKQSEVVSNARRTR